MIVKWLRIKNCEIIIDLVEDAYLCFCFQTCWCSIVIFSFVTERTNILHTFEYLTPEHRSKIERTIPANIRLSKDVLETSWRRLEDVFSVTFFCLPRRLEDIIARRLANTSWRRLEDIIARRLTNTSWRRLGRRFEDVLKTSWRRFRKTSWRRLEDVLGRRIANTSWRRLEDVLKRSWKTKSVTLKTSWRRLEDVLESKKGLLGWQKDR